MKEALLQRRYTEDIFSAFRDKNVIKVLTGIRRCGKSYLLRLFREKLLQEGIPDEHIIFIDFEDFENSRYTDMHVLYDFIKSTSDKLDNKRLYLLFDEIQEVVGWEKIVNSLYSSSIIDCDIYLTGSSAKLLSSELATYISGRYVLIPIFPLSYREFLEFSGQEDSSNHSFHG